MKPITNIASVQEAGESRRLPAGGYICKYKKVEDNPEKSYLYMEYDIAEGEYKGYYDDLRKRFPDGQWIGAYVKSYKQTALPMFKRMCSAVTKSNKKFIFDGNEHCDESTLVGRYVGMILGEEEYIGNDGSVKTRLYVVREVAIDDIKAGKFKVPELKKLPDTEGTSKPADDGFMNIPEGTDEETPFD